MWVGGWGLNKRLCVPLWRVSYLRFLLLRTFFNRKRILAKCVVDVKRVFPYVCMSYSSSWHSSRWLVARGSFLYFCGFLLKWMLCFVYSNIVIVMQTKGYVGVDEGEERWWLDSVIIPFFLLAGYVALPDSLWMRDLHNGGRRRKLRHGWVA